MKSEENYRANAQLADVIKAAQLEQQAESGREGAGLTLGPVAYVEIPGRGPCFKMVAAGAVHPEYLFDKAPADYAVYVRDDENLRFAVVTIVIADKDEAIVETVSIDEEWWGNLELRRVQAPGAPIKGLVNFLRKPEIALNMAQAIINGGSLVADVSTEWNVTEGEWDLNDNQRRAFSAIVGEGVCAVWGPPGTGKTKVIAEAISFLARQDPRVSVAIVSGTNVAVDAALVKAYKKLESVLPEGDIIRVGNPSNNEVRTSPLFVENVTKAAGRSIEARIEALYAQKREVIGYRQSDEELALVTFLSRCGGVDALRVLADREQLADLTRRICTADEELEDINRALRDNTWNHLWYAISMQETLRAEHEDTVLRMQTLSARRVALTENMSRRLMPKKGRIRQQLAELEYELRDITEADARSLVYWKQFDAYLAVLAEWDPGYTRSKYNLLLEDRAQVSITIDAARAAEHQMRTSLVASGVEPLDLTDSETAILNEMRAHYTSFAGLVAVKQRLDAKADNRRSKIADIEQHTRELHAQLSGVEREIIDNARVVGTTLSMLFGDPRLAARSFDYVIVDEAAAAIAPYVVGALAKATRGAALIGDFEQNAPISAYLTKKDPTAPNPESGVLRWLQQDPFQCFGIHDAVSATSTSGCVVLTKQYRYNSLTMEIANDLCYNGQLTLGKEWPSLNPPEITIIDTSDIDAGMLRRPPGSSSAWWWPIGPAVARQVAVTHSSKLVGVVTPYKYQSQLTSNVLLDANITNAYVGTSHRFQGQEFDVVLADLVTNSDQRSWMKYARRPDSNRSMSSFDVSCLNGLRVFNVAVTRNMGKLYLLCSVSAIKSSRPGSALYAIRTLLNRDALEIIGVREFLGPSAATPAARHDDGHAYQSAGSLMFCTNREYYELLGRDLMNAKHSVVLYSPFVGNGNGIASVLISQLQQLSTDPMRSVKLDIYTKHESEMPSDMKPALAELQERLGTHVHPRKATHEKLVVIDEHISYFGSLNSLSFGGRSKEIMLRQEGVKFARELLAFLE